MDLHKLSEMILNQIEWLSTQIKKNNLINKDWYKAFTDKILNYDYY